MASKQTETKKRFLITWSDHSTKVVEAENVNKAAASVQKLKKLIIIKTEEVK